MVKSRASCGAILCHITCVSGLPCSSSNGGPDPPCRKWMRAPDVSISRTWKRSNTSFAATGASIAALPAQQRGELANVGQRVDAPDRVEHPLRMRAIKAAPLRALPELVGELVVAHRIGRTALAEIGRPTHGRAIVELDFDDRRHLVEAGGLGF